MVTTCSKTDSRTFGTYSLRGFEVLLRDATEEANAIEHSGKIEQINSGVFIESDPIIATEPGSRFSLRHTKVSRPSSYKLSLVKGPFLGACINK